MPQDLLTTDYKVRVRCGACRRVIVTAAHGGGLGEESVSFAPRKDGRRVVTAVPADPSAWDEMMSNQPSRVTLRCPGGTRCGRQWTRTMARLYAEVIRAWRSGTDLELD